MWYLYTCVHKCHPRLIPERVAEASQIFFRDAHVLQNYLAMRNTADLTGGKPISVWLQYISGGEAVNPLVAFYYIYGRKREGYSFVLSRTPHETILLNIFCIFNLKLIVFCICNYSNFKSHFCNLYGHKRL
jgi:hypothetical protein